MDACHVLMREEKMVSPKQWAQAIRDLCFGLAIDTTYNPKKKSGVFGYRPCKHYRKKVGYELEYVRQAEDPMWFNGWDDYLKGASKKYDFCVSFGICDDSDAILIAGAVLARITGGTYFDVDIPMSTKDALALAGKMELKAKPSTKGK